MPRRHWCQRTALRERTGAEKRRRTPEVVEFELSQTDPVRDRRGRACPARMRSRSNGPASSAVSIITARRVDRVENRRGITRAGRVRPLRSYSRVPCPPGRATMGMKTEDLPNRTRRVFEGAASEADPATAKSRAAHTPPIDIIGGPCLTLYSDGTRSVFEGAGLRPNWVNSVSWSARKTPADLRSSESRHATHECATSAPGIRHSRFVARTQEPFAANSIRNLTPVLLAPLH